MLVKNVRIVDAQMDIIGQVTVRNGLFHEVSSCPQVSGSMTLCENGENTVIDGGGNILMPAFTDLHAHFREPGYTNKEDIESGSRAAVKGGYTTVVLMANTNPVCSSMDTVNYVINRAREIGLIDVFQVVSITGGMKGESISHLKFIDDTVRFVSDDGKGVMNDLLMEEALSMSKDNNFIVISHAEDHRYSETDMRMAENSMTGRDIEACLKTGGRLHLAHVSTKEAMEMVKAAKMIGANITCETTPHHIYAADDIVYRVNPPLRKPDDISSLINAIQDGYVDTISTDHAPHTASDKANGAPGISGIETAFQLCLTKLVKGNGAISLGKLSELMSYNPSKIAKVNKGLIKQGYEADFVIVDVNKRSKIDVNGFASKGKNSPFDGADVFGEILMTVKKGIIVYTKH
ncbi:MAG: dihydroorotase [Synergistaceae bacterium]|nr:dihydroorotase [Synergistaceae bacterium]